MEIAPGIHVMGSKKGGYVRAFLQDDGTDLTLIDTLFETDGRLILDQLAAMGRTVKDLKNIVLTHGHRSHLGGMAALKKLSGATVYTHEWEADIISGDRKAQNVTLRPIKPYKTYPYQLGLALGLGDHPHCEVDKCLKDGDRIGPAQVMHTPGHSPGHLAFYWPERRVLITGDAVCTWPDFRSGWPSFTLNWKQQRASIRRMAQVEIDAVAVGHGDPITKNATQRMRALAMASQD
jgi:glyoxylase-like metal-dependent hydrolase (beta-lactamase superfamily II)